MFKTTLALALSAVSLASAPLAAQAPYLVKDINTTYSSQTKSSGPNSFVSFRNKIYFVASTDAQGAELWSTDGTPDGTAIFADLVPGSASSSPEALLVVNNLLTFNARDADHGIELWVSDGTTAGTHLLTDINPGPSSSQPGSRIVFNNKLLFAADDGSSGRELWITDGTAGGTKLLKDLNPGSNGSFPTSFFRFGSSVYFQASNALWKTDGTEAGTIKLAETYPRHWVQLGSRLFFEGIPNGVGTSGWELWTTDGTAAGTNMVMDLNPNGSAFDSSSQTTPVVIGDKMLFFATDGVHGREMWVSDGTVAGTHMVRDFVPGAKGMWDGIGYVPMVALNGRAYFNAQDAEHGQELWVTDGTDAGTSLFIDFLTGSGSSYPWAPLVVGSKIIFATSSPTLPFGGSQLWVSDGSVAGTHMLTSQVGLSNNLAAVSIIDGKLYFSGANGLYGSEPWVTDGTDAGTRMIANIASDRAPSATPYWLTAAGNQLFFFARDDSAYGNGSLWRSDGTAGGTYKVVTPNLIYDHPVAVGSSLIYTELGNNQWVLRMTDGTPGNTTSIDAFLAHFGGKPYSALWSFGDTLFAKTNSDSQLWTATAGSDAPGVPLGVYGPFGFTEFCGRYLFFAQVGINQYYRYGLWVTDGTLAGTWPIYPDFGDGAGGGMGKLAVAGGSAYFLASVRDQKVKLWKSDGTLDGTVAVKTLPYDSTSNNPIVAIGRRVFFLVGSTLWTSDGTEGGTVILAQLNVKGYPAVNLAAASTRLVFNFTNAADEPEVWSSDGTVDGTRLLLEPGVASELTSVDGTVYFTATDDAHGHELWSSDGTPEGTKLLYDLNPGPNGSDPAELTKLGNAIYFDAYTDLTGSELWALPLTQPQLSINDIHATEGDSGTTTARFTVTLSPAPKQTTTVDWATSDGTARAGEDYDAASGTLTFVAGQTTKTVDVRVRGDVAPENNETFFVTLRNAHAALIVRGEGAASIDDDDQAADLFTALSVKDAGVFGLSDSVSVANAGPRGASQISLKINSTPGFGDSGCSTCVVQQLLPGVSVTAGNHSSVFTGQVYFSATATGRQRDPQPVNNTTTWTVGPFQAMVMSPAYVTVGGAATVSVHVDAKGVTPTTSDASVVAVSSMTKSSDTFGTFTVTGLQPGTATVSVAGQSATLLVTVIAAGAQPRWPGGVGMGGDTTGLLFHRPLNIVADVSGTAPISGATATGTIVVSIKGQEVARRTFTGTRLTFPIYMPALGQNDYTIAYSGDANFLPSSVNKSVYVDKGTPSVYATLESVSGAAAGTFRLTVHASGSPTAAPSGSVSILNGTTEVAHGTLAAAETGASTSQMTIVNLPPFPTLTVKYLGDTFYNPSTLQVRPATSRRHIVGR